MASMGNPCYRKARILTENDLNSLPLRELVYSYTVIDCIFQFPQTVKYPNISVYIDKSTTVYPTSGSAVINGCEYLLAKRLGCHFIIKEIFHIPFDCEESYMSQFCNTLKTYYPHLEGSPITFNITNSDSCNFKPELKIIEAYMKSSPEIIGSSNDISISAGYIYDSLKKG